MKCLLVAINAKYIHSNLAVYSLKACAEEARRRGRLEAKTRVEIAEYTINHRAAEILDDIYMQKADLLCFSCYIWNIEYVKTLVRNLKRLRPGVPIWLGGPEVSSGLTERLAEIPEADGILYGEGERSFPELLHFYEERASLGIRQEAADSFAEREQPEISGFSDMPPPPKGLAYRDENGQAVITPPQESADLDQVPFVYRTVWDEGFKHRILYYETSRGCPFSCSYCLSCVDRKLRFRSLSRVYEELAFFLEKQVPQVKFVDRTFNCRKDRAAAIWTFLRDHDNGITNFHFEIGAELLDDECLALLETMRPGLLQFEIGVQSANPKTLEAVRRPADLEKLSRVTKQVKRGRNIRQHLDLIAGLPFEDYESFGRSFDQVYAMEPDELQLGFLKVLKGTPMYEEAEHYHMLYQAEAPFEVLETPWLSHEDVIRLKQVEEMVEIYHNSRQFLYSMKLLSVLFESPFQMYQSLGADYVRRGMGKRKHIRAELYEFLLDHVREQFPQAETELRQSLTVDYYLREHAKKRPGFAPSQDPYKDEIRKRLAAHFPERPLKQLLREIHVERFWTPLSERESYLMFDYENRDLLTGNAALIHL